MYVLFIVSNSVKQKLFYHLCFICTPWANCVMNQISRFLRYNNSFALLSLLHILSIGVVFDQIKSTINMSII